MTLKPIERVREREKGRQRTERRREKDLGCLWIRKEKDDKKGYLDGVSNQVNE